MTTYLLRPYQEQSLEALREHIRQGHRRLILCAPTGSGKTVTISAMIERTVAKRKQALFLAHRRELVHQCSEKLSAYGVPHGIIMGKDRRVHHTAPCQIASIPTLHSRFAKGIISPPPADLVIVDECHHATARTWASVLERYPNAIIVGLSATPSRKNGKPLSDLFDVIVPSAGYAELIREGYLVPTKVWAPSIPDLRGIKVTAGDYNEKQLDQRMNKTVLIGDVVKTWQKRAEGRPTLCYAVTINHSEHLAEAFRDAGVKADHIDGTMDVLDRDSILDQFRSGELDVLCNCMVLTEGVDIPIASCAILARPTRSLVLYRQMAGRIQRPAPGKTDAIILDHSGAAIEHGMPDEDLEWDLAEHTIAEKKATADARAKSVIRCRECGFILKPGSVACPQCAAVLPKRKTGRLVRNRDGELREITGRRGADLKQHQLQRLWIQYVFVAKARKQRIKVAEGMFYRSTGKWPMQARVFPRPDATDRGVPAGQWYAMHASKFPQTARVV